MTRSSLAVLLLWLPACGAASALPVAPPPPPPPPAPPGATSPSSATGLDDFVPGMSESFWSPRSEISVDGAIVPVASTIPDALRAHASRLTHCPIERLAGRWVWLGSPHNPLAMVFVEGCGQRVTYAFATPDSSGPPRHAELYTMGHVVLEGGGP